MWLKCDRAVRIRYILLNTAVFSANSRCRVMGIYGFKIDFSDDLTGILVISEVISDL